MTLEVVIASEPAPTDVTPKWFYSKVCLDVLLGVIFTRRG